MERIKSSKPVVFLAALGPQEPMEIHEGFTPPKYGRLTPKSEGFGFPWWSVGSSGFYSFQVKGDA